jgi:transcription-repair coupling factor (superfamily II helicase)
VRAGRDGRRERPMRLEELPEADLPIPAFLPEEYMPNEAERLAIYRKMTFARNQDDVRLIQEELRDRFGPLPAPAFNLVRILKIRVFLLHGHLRGITKGENEVLIRLKPGDQFADADLAGAYAALNQKDARSRQHVSLRKLEGLVLNTRALSPPQVLRVIEILTEALCDVRGKRLVL